MGPRFLLQRLPNELVILVCLSALMTGCRSAPPRALKAIPANAAGVHTYSTTFAVKENPVSEGGVWIGGSSGGSSLWKGHLLRRGRLWGDVQTVPGFAFGVDEPTEFGDPTAILAGNWGPTQTVTDTVRIKHTHNGNDCCQEVSVRLRMTISRLSITGYEAYCSVEPRHPYCHIARWNGPNGSYWNFETGTSAVYLVDGDVLKATATGTNPTVITLYRNGERVLEAVDTGAAGGGFGAYGPWTSGNPGFGFYNNHETKWEDFGVSSFSATDDPGAEKTEQAAGIH